MMKLILINTTLIFSVLLGGLIVSSIEKKKNEQIIKLMVAFSGGFLLSIAFIHFIPELYENNNLNIGTYILIGFLIQLILEFFSKGIEHGHVHVNKSSKVPVTLFIALSIHALLEGIPLGTELLGIKTIDYHSHNNNPLLLGILLHRLPVSIALMTLLLNSNIRRGKSWFILILFSITTPIGLYIGYNVKYIVDINFNIILAVVVGMFLHISTTIIFETSENHRFNLIKLLTILSGCSIAFLMN